MVVTTVWFGAGTIALLVVTTLVEAVSVLPKGGSGNSPLATIHSAFSSGISDVFGAANSLSQRFFNSSAAPTNSTDIQPLVFYHAAQTSKRARSAQGGDFWSEVGAVLAYGVLRLLYPVLLFKNPDLASIASVIIAVVGFFVAVLLAYLALGLPASCSASDKTQFQNLIVGNLAIFGLSVMGVLFGFAGLFSDDPELEFTSAVAGLVSLSVVLIALRNVVHLHGRCPS